MRSSALLLLLSALVCSVDPAGAQKVVVHGYVTQGLGSASEYAQAGLGTDATADIRAAALQARLLFPSIGTQIVVQGAHRRVGGSPMAEIIDEVELDWAFFQQKLGPFSARAGRVPLPKGLLNEVRDVGIILPFFRAPNAYYTEGVETLDGASAGFSYIMGPVEVDAQGFYGTIPVVMQISSPAGPKAMSVDGKSTVGGQLALGLPLRGLKLLGGYLDADVSRMVSTPMGPMEVTADWRMNWIGAEYAGDRIVARAEKNRSEVPGSNNADGVYFQASAKVIRGLWASGQYEKASVDIVPMNMEYDSTEDWVAGLSYAFGRHLVLKGEHHWSDGYNTDEAVNLMGPPVNNRYFLLSLSAAF